MSEFNKHKTVHRQLFGLFEKYVLVPTDVTSDFEFLGKDVSRHTACFIFLTFVQLEFPMFEKKFSIVDLKA